MFATSAREQLPCTLAGPALEGDQRKRQFRSLKLCLLAKRVMPWSGGEPFPAGLPERLMLLDNKIVKGDTSVTFIAFEEALQWHSRFDYLLPDLEDSETAQEIAANEAARLKLSDGRTKLNKHAYKTRIVGSLWTRYPSDGGN